MSGSVRRDQISEFSPCPSVRSEQYSQHSIDRRNLLALGGIIAGSIAVGSSGLVKMIDSIDTLVSKERWPNDAIRIVPTMGSEHVRPGGRLNLFFGGFGQKDAINASQEYFDAIDSQEFTAAIVYSNQRFTIEDLADPVEELLIENQFDEINIVGPSMGLPIGIMTYGAVMKRRFRAGGGILGASASAGANVPKIDKLIGYSSPADMRDAMDGEIAGIIAAIARNTKKPPGAILKWLYSFSDGDGDVKRGLNFHDSEQQRRHLQDTWAQTMNGTAPGTASSHIVIMDDFNAARDCGLLQPMFIPGKSQLIYTKPSDYDNTVNNESSILTYESVLEPLNVPTTVLNTGPVGHAHTYSSAQVLKKYRQEQQIAMFGSQVYI